MESFILALRSKLNVLASIWCQGRDLGVSSPSRDVRWRPVLELQGGISFIHRMKLSSKLITATAAEAVCGFTSVPVMVQPLHRDVPESTSKTCAFVREGPLLFPPFPGSPKHQLKGGSQCDGNQSLCRDHSVGVPVQAGARVRSKMPFLMLTFHQFCKDVNYDPSSKPPWLPLLHYNLTQEQTPQRSLASAPH